MNYELVHLSEKTVAGLRMMTSNKEPNMTRDIGELWQEFFAKGIYQSIAHKKNDKNIGLYSNYESGANGAFDMMVCCEVQNASNLPSGVYTQTIPAGEYAKFIVKGDVQKAVAEFWMKLESMDLDRKYSCDFEEYLSGCDMKNAEIHIYIALN